MAEGRAKSLRSTDNGIVNADADVLLGVKKV
jgi:hypothetical protein